MTKKILIWTAVIAVVALAAWYYYENHTEKGKAKKAAKDAAKATAAAALDEGLATFQTT